jgi:HMG (high mobility group) box
MLSLALTMADPDSLSAAVAASALSEGEHSVDPASFGSIPALISYLRIEANLAEQRAKRLRDQADSIADHHGITEQDLEVYAHRPSELAPLDKNGRPKYKGRKRGRKPKEKQRKHNPDRKKRKHTGYTKFMQETFPIRKSEHPELKSKDLISMVARQWKELNDEERDVWKTKAAAGSSSSPTASSSAAPTIMTTKAEPTDSNGGRVAAATSSVLQRGRIKYGSSGSGRKVICKRVLPMRAMHDEFSAAAEAAAARDEDEDDDCDHDSEDDVDNDDEDNDVENEKEDDYDDDDDESDEVDDGNEEEDATWI